IASSRKALSLLQAATWSASGDRIVNYKTTSDVETSSGNTFTAGTLNLEVGEDDPCTWSFGGEDLEPGDSGSSTALIKNSGSIAGDASLDIAISNDSGELDEYLRVTITLDEDGDWSTTGDQEEIVRGLASNITGTEIEITHDAWINEDTTNTQIKVHWKFVDKSGVAEAEGDKFDLNLTFHLEQS
ncbi:hypothetical protein AKJ57_05450, partial [candidate division MSBL1 archaeon SCGC-AAA259A05]